MENAVRLLLLALIALSLWLFWRHFEAVVRRILRARPETDFKFETLATRLWQFFSEVLCQTKVIRERPLPG